MLGRRGFEASPQRVYRLYRAEGLMVRRLKRKRLTRVLVASELMRSNQEWALDVVSDALATGRGIRALTVVDAFTRENLSLEVDTSLSSRRVTRALEEMIERRGAPEAIRCDNGPEPPFPELVRGAQDSADPYPAGQADAEWSYRKLQRPAA